MSANDIALYKADYLDGCLDHRGAKMIVKAVALQPRTTRNDFWHNMERIKQLFLQVSANDEGVQDKIVVVLPEYVTGMVQPGQVEYFIDLLRDIAQTHGFIIIGGSYPRLDEDTGRYLNFSPLIDSSGRMRGGHHKIHLFRFEKKQYMLPGNTVTRCKVDGLNIGQLICSDMWHPDLVMRLRDVDLLTVPIMTSVPDRNQVAYARWSWYCLATTRAKENVVPIIISDSAEGHWWGEFWISGASSINDPSHRFLPEEGPNERAQVVLSSGKEGKIELNLDLKKIAEYRRYREEVGLLLADGG